MSAISEDMVSESKIRMLSDVTPNPLEAWTDQKGRERRIHSVFELDNISPRRSELDSDQSLYHQLSWVSGLQIV